AATQRHGPPRYRRDGLAKMKDDAMRFVNGAHELAELGTHHALERLLLRRDDVDAQAAGAERCGHLQTDEARAHHDDPRRLLCALNNRAAVRERAEIAYGRTVSARNGESHGFGARGE